MEEVGKAVRYISSAGSYVSMEVDRDDDISFRNAGMSLRLFWMDVLGVQPWAGI